MFNLVTLKVQVALLTSDDVNLVLTRARFLAYAPPVMMARMNGGPLTGVRSPPFHEPARVETLWAPGA
jgi:hypothetical protein